MAIQGIFLADFSQYNAAVDGADAKLRKFTASTTSHDTASRQFNTTTDRGATSFGNLATGLQAADKTLGAFGVHIGPEIHALEELSQAAGKTAGEIGLIGTVSLVTAAALGGWEIGRTISKFLDLDKTIGDATAKLLGFGDVAAETAAAKQDVLARATQNAHRQITDYNEAVEINIRHEKDAALAAKEHAKELETEKKAAEDAAEALKKLQEAHVKEIQTLQGKLFGADDIKAATDYLEALGRVENVATLDSEALQALFDALSKGIGKMVEQGLAADDLTNQMEQYRLAVVAAQQSHTGAVVQMETDEARFKRENDELAKAMKDNFVVIGQSAQEAAQKVSMSFSQAMDAVRAGQGTLSGSFQSIAPGATGSTIRYDDYGNPYGYIPGVNNPGRISPSGGAGHVVINANNSFFDTPSSLQHLADKVTTALGSRVASQGGR